MVTKILLIIIAMMVVFPAKTSSDYFPEKTIKSRGAFRWIFIDKPLDNNGVLTAIEKI